ncbi:MAG: hypothetical protein ACREJM_08660 [Candidatus Saccharimonadales bacterium]
MLFPGSTGLGEAELVTLSSYWPGDATVTFVVTELLSGFGSVTLEFMLAVSEIMVPDGVAAFTLRTRVNVAFAPEARFAIEAAMLPVPPTNGVVHDQPDGQDSDKNVA